MLPGLEEIRLMLMVWIESMIAMSGALCEIVSAIASASVAVSMYRFSESTPRR